jgi:hypothetical protein
MAGEAWNLEMTHPSATPSGSCHDETELVERAKTQPEGIVSANHSDPLESLRNAVVGNGRCKGSHARGKVYLARGAFDFPCGH